MSNFINYPQKNTKLTGMIALCAILSASQLIGCTKSDDKKTDKKPETTKTEAKASALDCTSPKAVSSIQQALSTQIAQQASNTVQQLGQQAGLNVSNVTMANTMSQLMVNVQNIKPVTGQIDQCQGTVSVTLPETDIANANQLAASLNQPTLVQRLNGKGLTLENNTVIAQNVGFKLVATNEGYTATPISADSIINEISNVLANSQLKQLMVSNSTTTVTNSAVNKTAVGAAVGAATTTTVTRQYTRPQPKPVEQQKSTSKPAAQATATPNTTKKSSETTSTQSLTDSSTKTEIKSAPTKPATTTSVNTRTTSIEKTVTTKAVPNDNTKLTIEEKNEKY